MGNGESVKKTPAIGPTALRHRMMVLARHPTTLHADARGMAKAADALQRRSEALQRRLDQRHRFKR
jgi:hypothetical protein